MKLSTIFNRILSNKISRSINQYERTQQKACEQAYYDDIRRQFCEWADKQPDNHPIMDKVVFECNKLQNNITLSDAVKMKRYNAIFSNAWAVVESEQN
jgi:hypothetical protein